MLLLAVPMLSFAQELTIDEQIEEKFKPFADAVSAVVFYPISIAGIDVPIVVILLLSGAFFFTLYFKFSNITLLGVAIRATNGKYDEIDHSSNDNISQEDVAGCQQPSMHVLRVTCTCHWVQIGIVLRGLLRVNDGCSN